MKKLNKADYNFNRNVKYILEEDSRKRDPHWFEQHKPIHIPKRKKFKRK